MASHARPRHRSRVPRGLTRAGLALTVAGAALAAAGAAPAGAASGRESDLDVQAAGKALGGALQHSLAGGVGPVKSLKLDPLAGTTADPLTNKIGTQVADFKPLTTGIVTDPIASGGALEDLPLTGAAVGLLPG
ncbi:hypothetical protein [Streptomyces chrestomyceticus]|uniref:ATP-binding protein n=1 Tax=Streptomyces chrestomyceticus TaxID=68185 RepID=A0ABU7WMM4_9ACTN